MECSLLLNPPDPSPFHSISTLDYEGIKDHMRSAVRNPGIAIMVRENKLNFAQMLLRAGPPIEISESLCTEVYLDGEETFKAIHASLLWAKRSIYIISPFLELNARLVRGEAALLARRTASLYRLLRHVTRKDPNLTIHLLSGDNANTKDNTQTARTDQKNSIHRTKPTGMVDNHIFHGVISADRADGLLTTSFIVIDDQLALVGNGTGLFSTNWDTALHLPRDPLRTNSRNFPHLPNHTMAIALTGPAAQAVGKEFRNLWMDYTGDTITPPSSPQQTNLFTMESISPNLAAVGQQLNPFLVPKPAILLGRLKLALTTTARGTREPAPSLHPQPKTTSEIQNTPVNNAAIPSIDRAASILTQAIEQAERMIYVETGYLTSQIVVSALINLVRSRSSNMGAGKDHSFAAEPERTHKASSHDEGDHHTWPNDDQVIKLDSTSEQTIEIILIISPHPFSMLDREEALTRQNSLIDQLQKTILHEGNPMVRLGIFKLAIPSRLPSTSVIYKPSIRRRIINAGTVLLFRPNREETHYRPAPIPVSLSSTTLVVDDQFIALSTADLTDRSLLLDHSITIATAVAPVPTPTPVPTGGSALVPATANEPAAPLPASSNEPNSLWPSPEAIAQIRRTLLAEHLEMDLAQLEKFENSSKSQGLTHAISSLISQGRAGHLAARPIQRPRDTHERTNLHGHEPTTFLTPDAALATMAAMNSSIRGAVKKDLHTAPAPTLTSIPPLESLDKTRTIRASGANRTRPTNQTRQSSKGASASTSTSTTDITRSEQPAALRFFLTALPGAGLHLLRACSMLATAAGVLIFMEMLAPLPLLTPTSASPPTLPAVVAHNYIIDSYQWITFIPGQMGWAPAIFIILLGMLSHSINFPVPLLAIISGILFGPVKGLAVASASTTISAVLSHGVGRLMGPGAIKKSRIPAKDDDQIQELLENHSWRNVLLLRLTGIMPFHLVSLLTGIASGRITTVTTATLIGSLPWLLLLPTRSHLIAQLVYGSRPHLLVALSMITVSLLIAISLNILFHKRASNYHPLTIQ